jgi:glutamine synthetase
MLPTSLGAALDALEQNSVFRQQLGEVFLDYFLKLKRNEAGRYQRWLEENGPPQSLEAPTQWEHNEYFDFF